MNARVCFVKGLGGLPMLKIESASSTAEIYLHGAHVTHFQRHDEPPLLWISRESKFEPGKPIRGGIPVILPWFGPRENAPAHGFARIKEWELVEIATLKGGMLSIHLRLPYCEEMESFGAFTADYLVTIGDELDLELILSNPSRERELAIEECLHTYFAIGDISEISVSGLKRAKYLDKVGGSVEKTETNDFITFASEVDRVYMDTATPVEILDRKLRRKIRVEKEDSVSTVVWNPWIAKAKAMPDFGDEEYREMVCVESGNVGKNHLALGPEKSATMRVRLSTESLT
jgi:D-hexose-6-phosphate mutarotase